MMRAAVVLFSGGSDSCATALELANEFNKIYLITFKEYATEKSTVPFHRIEKLRNLRPQIEWVHHVENIDETLKILSYKDYFYRLARFGLLNICTPGFSSMAWHIQAIKFSKTVNAKIVADGLTRELLHLPGHQDFFLRLLRELYSKNGLTYINPVRDWEIPPEQNILDRVIVDRAGSSIRAISNVPPKSTSYFLFQQGFLESPNMKGSRKDQNSQHDCYPFVVYNLMYFWIYTFFFTTEKVNEKIEQYFKYMFSQIEKWKLL